MLIQTGPRKCTPFQETKGVVTIERGMLKQKLAAMAHVRTTLHTGNGINQVQQVRLHVVPEFLLHLKKGPNTQVKRLGPAFAVTRFGSRLQSIPFLAIKAVRRKGQFGVKKEGLHTSLFLCSCDHREEHALCHETEGRRRHLGAKGIHNLIGGHG